VFFFLQTNLEYFRKISYNRYLAFHPKYWYYGKIRKIFIRDNYYWEEGIDEFLEQNFHLAINSNKFLIILPRIFTAGSFIAYNLVNHLILSNNYFVKFFKAFKMAKHVKLFINLIYNHISNYLKFYMYYRLMNIAKHFITEKRFIYNLSDIPLILANIDIDFIRIKKWCDFFFQKSIAAQFCISSSFINNFLYVDFLIYVKSNKYFEKFLKDNPFFL